MNIIGQDKAKTIIESLIKYNIINNRLTHILLVAPSGHGKTLLGRYTGKLLSAVKRKKVLYFSSGSMFYDYFTKNPRYSWEKFILFIDEIHTLPHEEEIFPLFEKTDIIAATNIMGLPEALKQRFRIITLQRYKDEDLKKIFKLYYGKDVDDEVVNRMIKLTRAPRLLKEYAHFYAALGEDFWKLMVAEDGLTQEEFEYLSALKILGGIASFNRIRTYLGYSPRYVTEIETRLVAKGKIQITNRGRELVEIEI